MYFLDNRPNSLLYKNIISYFFAAQLCIISPVAASEDASAKGLEIAREADRRDRGFIDFSVSLTMTLVDQRQHETIRNMRQMNLEVDGDGDKTIMVFDTPRDLKGTAILTFTHKIGSDDQWLYLPELKRVKRISSSNKSGPFVGSEFAYEDLASQEVEKYSYRYLGDEACGIDQCFMVERVPVDKKSGYSRQVTWIDQNEYRMRKIDYFDRKGDRLKTMVLSGYQQYLEQYWRPDAMLMTNHQNGKSTNLSFQNYRFRQGLEENDFTRGGLAEIR